MAYAFNYKNSREVLWKEMGEIASAVRGPWMVGRDCNCVLSSDERIGAQVWSWKTEPLRLCLIQCDLHYLSSRMTTSIHGIINRRGNLECMLSLAEFLGINKNGRKSTLMCLS